MMKLDLNKNVCTNNTMLLGVVLVYVKSVLKLSMTLAVDDCASDLLKNAETNHDVTNDPQLRTPSTRHSMRTSCSSLKCFE